MKDVYGTVYDQDGTPIDSYTSGTVSLYREATPEVPAVAASFDLDVVITAAMLEGQTNVTITIE